MITSYSRNLATAEELAKAGYRVLTEEQLLADPALDLLDGGKYLVQIKSAS